MNGFNRLTDINYIGITLVKEHVVFFPHILKISAYAIYSISIEFRISHITYIKIGYIRSRCMKSNMAITPVRPPVQGFQIKILRPRKRTQWKPDWEVCNQHLDHNPFRGNDRVVYTWNHYQLRVHYNCSRSYQGYCDTSHRDYDNLVLLNYNRCHYRQNQCILNRWHLFDMVLAIFSYGHPLKVLVRTILET